MAKTGFSSCIGCNSAWRPRLILIRGNSASGKSTVATAIRDRHGRRGLAIVSQDNLRRVVLREHDVPGGANIGLIDLTTRYAIGAGFHVVLEGILPAEHYGGMLARLLADYSGQCHAYYLDVPFAETLSRHAGKPQAGEYGETEMRQWYRERDLLPGGAEQVIAAGSSLDDTVSRVMADAGLSRGEPGLQEIRT
jgi:hypothetical protein